jgi:uncharacterized membrane protein
MKAKTEGKTAQMEGLSGSEQENLGVLAKFYDREDAETSRIQVAIERVSSFFGSPAYFGFAAVFIVAWIAINTLGYLYGWGPIDKPPFSYLQGIVSTNALLLTIAVLIRQNRMSQLAEHRAHLDLQINLLTEQKVTRLLQQQQKGLGAENPIAESPPDTKTAELTKPADPHAILAAIKRQDDQR